MKTVIMLLALIIVAPVRGEARSFYCRTDNSQETFELTEKQYVAYINGRPLARRGNGLRGWIDGKGRWLYFYKSQDYVIISYLFPHAQNSLDRYDVASCR